MKKLIFLALIFLGNSSLFGCSCEWVNFQDVYLGQEKAYVFKGVITGKPKYSLYDAVYIDVIDVYRNDFNITNSRVKFYGQEDSGYCYYDVHKNLKYQDTVYIAMGYFSEHPIPNPDAQHDINVFENVPSSCSFEVISSKNENILKGEISGDRSSKNQILEYPKSQFEEDLINNSFTSQTLKEYNAKYSSYSVYPNPIENGSFSLKTETINFNVDKIEIFSINGILEKTLTNCDKYYYSSSYDITTLNSGYYIFRIYCEDRIEVMKVVVE